MDGTVECFTGEHIALALFAMMVLVMCMALMIIMAAIVLKKLKVIYSCVMCLYICMLTTVVWEIFVRDNLVVKFIRCVIFSWVTYTHENILPSNLFALNTFYLRNICHYAKKIT